MFPSQDGVFTTPARENLFTAKGSANITPSQYLSVRYGRNTNSQVYGATTRRVQDSWGDSTNKFNSINMNHNWVLGGSKLNEFVFQYADFGNNVTARTGAAQETFPNGVIIGYNSNTPQTTEQHKFQFKDDFSWSLTGGGGLGHDFKAGVNFINEPHLFVTFSSGSTDYAYTHLTNDTAGPISAISRNKPGSSANLPMKQFGMYFQDDWRVTDRLTVNAGLRYDIVTGFDLDQSQITNFVALTQAAAAGRFNGVPGFEEFGRKTGEDTNNWQPRIGAVYDLRGNGKDVVRAGWGIYYDFGYTNANILFPGLSVQGGSGVIFSASNTARHPQPRWQLLRRRSADHQRPRTRSTRAYRCSAATWRRPASSSRGRASSPLAGRTSCRTTPFSTSTTCTSRDGTSACAGRSTRASTRRTGAMRISALNPPNPTMNMSVGESTFDGVNFGVRRRIDKGISLNAWYSLSKATGLGGLGVDELTSNLVQDSFNPYGDVQLGPSQRTDARHKITLSAVIQLPWGIYASPIFTYRSALPLFTSYGYDNNLDGVNNDLYPTAFKFDWRRRCRRSVVQGRWRVRVRQLQPGRGTVAVQPARVEGVPPAARHEHRGDRRRVQPLQRDQPGVRCGRSGSRFVLHRHTGESHAERCVHEADAVCG